jgi:site-specific recombinase XerC
VGEVGTPVLTPEDGRTLLDSIGDRDRALIGVMALSFARVAAVVGMQVRTPTPRKEAVVTAAREGGKYHVVPAHHLAVEYMDVCLQAAGIPAAQDIAVPGVLSP